MNDQGTWLKHPLHPVLVHIPTALWTAALVFDVLANLDIGGNAMVRTSFSPSSASAFYPFPVYLGGTMVYNDGIAVGRHHRHTDTPEETIRVPTEAADEFVPVAAANSLGNGETLRAEVRGHVMTIANLGGKFYAFQEFCTHRFGPLSEGHFHNHEIMRPWRRSCFDVRTGQVTQGPAKVDLKTYQVMVQDGQICVRAPGE